MNSTATAAGFPAASLPVLAAVALPHSPPNYPYKGFPGVCEKALPPLALPLL